MENKILKAKAHSFPKIFHIGDRWIRDIFDGDVEVTEKVDGSQFCFGKINGEVIVRSKGKVMVADAPDKMFSFCVSYVMGLDLPDNTLFYGEYLKSPRHNTLAYDRIPKNYIALFGVCSDKQEFISDYDSIKKWADTLNVDCVPLLFKGKINSQEELFKLLDTMSYLGGTKIEGVVVKRYVPVLIGSQVVPIMSGKFVSESFKEKHQGTWAKEHTGKGKWEVFKEEHRTEARWNKAIQHLREEGKITDTPKDIGILIKEIQNDITKEEQENIKDFLWKEFGVELLREAIHGMPEWYKKKLTESSFK